MSEMNSNLIPFQFEDFSIRVLTYEGQTWFCARDVAMALDYSNPAQAYQLHCKSLKLFSYLACKKLGVKNPNPQGFYFIKEDDVLRLLMKSTNTPDHIKDKLFSSIVLSSEKLINILSDIDLDIDDFDEYFVYAAQEVNTGNIKIGISKNPKRRINQLNIGNSSDVVLIRSVRVNNKFASERLAHQLTPNRIKGEWFACTNDQANNSLSLCA